MKNKLIIIGAGGHGKVVADIAVKNGYSNICFIDDEAKGSLFGYPIIGTTEILKSFNDGKTDFIIAIGNNAVRERIAEKFEVNWITLVHPSAQISIGAEISAGTVVMAGAVVNADAKVGKHCIINSTAVVEHDNIIEDYVHISPGAKLGGTVQVGKCSHIGIGATVRNNIVICKNTVVGAGAVVVKNIEEGTFVGVPARKM